MYRAPSYLAVALIAPLVASAQVLLPVADPLDRVEPYTLEIGPEGRPGGNYFYMGFVHGMPKQVVHLGFNGRQSTSRGGSVYRGGEFATPSVYRDVHGQRYYSLAWAGESLGQAIAAAKDRAAKNLVLSEADRVLAGLPDAIRADGKAYSNRARLNLFDPTTRGLLLRYVRAHVAAWSAETPHHATGSDILYWGLDNEWEGSADYSPEARAAFAAWLANVYGGDVAALNEAWTSGTDVRPAANHPFSSFEAASRDRLPAAADYAARPGAWLDWITFQSEHFTSFLAELGRAMNEADPLRRGVVHKSTQQTIEMPNVNRAHTFNHELFAELMRPISGGLLATDMYGAGDRQAYEVSYLYHSIRPLDGSRGYGVFLPETNNHGGPGHSFAATAWRMLANGLKAVDFFTLGFAGAQNDWDKFGFIDPVTGNPKDKLFYAGRWAHLVHRTEDFWKEATPVADVPRVALLMPRRDVLLADRSERTTSRWGYPRNHRWLVYRWLREQGYWVDVIPTTKLDAGYLASYRALFLVGAEHLSDAEVSAVSSFVKDGGLLVADTRPGYYDEHHRARPARLASLLGLDLKAAAPVAKASDGRSMIDTGFGHYLLADGRVQAKATTARTVFSDNARRPVVTVNATGTGKGRVLHLGFELGSAVLRKPADAMASFLLDGPTADTEEYALQDGELVIGQWIDSLLRRAGVTPAAQADETLLGTGNLRVEQPMADAAGNLAVVVATRADTAKRVLPAGTVTLPLPGGPWRGAFWASAEDDGLTEVVVAPVADAAVADLHRVALPPVSTAGVLYLFKDYAPVISIPCIASETRSADGHTAKLEPGRPAVVTIDVVNPSSSAFVGGALTLQALDGWSVEPSVFSVGGFATGERQTFSVNVTPPSDVALLLPEWIYPLVATLTDADGARRAVLTANVQVDLPDSEALHLLTENAHVPDTHPRKRKTGAIYAYEGTVPEKATISDPARPAKDSQPNSALTNGFNSRLGWRTTGGTPGAFNAVYATSKVTPVFDLKAPYEVRRVVINAGPGDNTPSRLSISTSLDGREWSEAASFELTPERANVREHTVILPAGAPKARHVKLVVEWAAEGGSLDEIEIWGR